MKILWICGVPNDVRVNGCGHLISELPTAAWSWILGHLPPPEGVELHALCPVMRLEKELVEFDYLGVHWHCVRQDNHEVFFLWRRMIKKMKPIVERISPDVIHGWGGETGCGYLATHLSRRAVVSIQGLLLMLDQILVPGGARKTGFKQHVRRAFFDYVEQKSYSLAAKRHCESILSKDALAKYYHGLESVVIPHPLRAEFLEEPKGREALCENAPRFLFVGQLVDRKGTFDAIKAYERAEIKDGVLVMVGSGDQEGAIKNYIAEHHLEERIILKSGLSATDLVREMQASQFFLLPTYGDTGPTALKEALAQGLYPICYDNSGPHELINRYLGTLVPTTDIEGLTGALKSCVAQQAELVHRSEEASKRVRVDHSPAQIWKELLSLYKEVEQ